MRNLVAKGLSLALATLAFPALAGPAVPETSGWEFSIQYQKLSLDAQAAKGEFIKDSANSFKLGVDYFFANSPWTLGGGFGVIDYSDTAGFSQLVEDNFGDRYTKSSDATATRLFLETGVTYPLGLGQAFLVGKVGLETLLSSERSIENCDNCASEDIDIDAGPYGLVRFGTLVGPVELALDYQYYLSGDLTSGVGISLSSHFY